MLIEDLNAVFGGDREHGKFFWLFAFRAPATLKGYDLSPMM
jgi:hypothetical protein